MRRAGPDVDGFARKSGFPPPNFAEPLVDAREVFHGLQESPIDLGQVPDFRVHRRYRAQSAMMIVKDNKVQVAPAHDCSVVRSREGARVEDSDSGDTMLVEQMRISSMFDSADAYSAGRAEEILGQAIKRRRDKVIISTKAAFRVGPGPNDVGSSRYHLIRAVEGSLKRLATDYIDLYQLHAFDRTTPAEETLGTLDDLVKAGKIRYIGCSNFSGWHLMKSLAVSKEYGLAR
jgi:Aldo/keto reductase family